jgi:four helix bundle protein
MEKKTYIPLKELKVYQLARQLSTKAWLIYSKMSFEDKKHIGDQFIRLVDSVGANIAEGYYRFYYLDKCRFYYNSRASLAEAIEQLAGASSRKGEDF